MRQPEHMRVAGSQRQRMDPRLSAAHMRSKTIYRDSHLESKTDYSIPLS